MSAAAALAPDALFAALDELLEAERAGARATRELAVQMAASPLTDLVRDVQQGELHWCRMLMGHITRLGATPSALTGDFWAKVMAEEGTEAKLALLNRGQGWVVRKLNALLPGLTDAALAADLLAMRDAHTENIARVDAAVAAAPAAAVEPPPPTEPAALVAHITRRYHGVHRQQLARLVGLADAAEAAERGHAHWPAALPGQLRAMQAELHSHMAKEEQILFPLLARGGHPFAAQPIRVMRHEHAAHESALAPLLAARQAPADAGPDWRALAAELAVFARDLQAHIALENDVLFPPFESAGAEPATEPASPARGRFTIHAV